MTRSKSGHFLPEIARCDGHASLPVFPHQVVDRDRDRAAETEPAAHAAHDRGAIAFHLLSLAPPVSLLSARELVVYVGGINWHAGRIAIDDDCQLRTVRLSRG